MANSWFQFKKFRVNQDKCAMKISTDAVMLGALVDAEDKIEILEIGAGTGVVSLMLAQRFPKTIIHSVEIEQEAYQQCKDNFLESPFFNQLNIYHSAIQDFPVDQKFDLIVTNPPYYPDHLKPKDEARLKALHTDDLSFQELITEVKARLSQYGSLWIILPTRQMGEFSDLANRAGLKVSQSIQITDRPGKAVHRIICEFKWDVEQEITKSIYLKTVKSEPSPEYQELLTEFFLDF